MTLLTPKQMKQKANNVRNKIAVWSVASEDVMSERLNECSCEELRILCKYYEMTICRLAHRMFRLEVLGRG